MEEARFGRNFVRKEVRERVFALSMIEEDIEKERIL